MKIEVTVGQTRAPEHTVLVPVMLGDPKDDRVFFLLHSEGKAEGSSNLQEECMSVLTHAVLEGDGDGAERLESALKELNGLLKGFLLSAAVTDVHAIVGLLEPSGVLHLSHVGRSEAYLVRDGTASQITEYARGKPPSAFMHIVSGPIEEGDEVMLSTQRLLRTLTPSQLAGLVATGGDVVRAIVRELEDEKEVACLAHIRIEGAPDRAPAPRRGVARPMMNARATRQRSDGPGVMARMMDAVKGFKMPEVKMSMPKMPRMSQSVKSTNKAAPKKSEMSEKFSNAKEWLSGFFAQFTKDLRDPKRKRRAHLLLVAGSAALFLILWMVVQLTLSSQKLQTRGELATLLQQVTADISTAENRQLAGDSDSANAILQRAEERAQQVMDSESGLFRSQALELMEKIKSKREEINKVVRITPPRVMANISATNPDVVAQGFIGQPNGEFLVYDRQDLYQVSLNSVEKLDPLGTDELLLDGDALSRFQSNVFMTTGNSVVEWGAGQATTMKTEDPAGWVTGSDMKTYLRYVYVLSPERKQIYKYERLSGRYGPPAEYNVNGDLTGALDMTITGAVYVLKDVSAAEGGTPGKREVIKLSRGEKQPFNIRNLPPNALDGVTKVFKSSANGNFYFLDPVNKRIVVSTNDGDIGDSLYLKQFILDAEQVGKLKDLYVDAEDSRLYVLDEKRVYAIDLQAH